MRDRPKIIQLHADGRGIREISRDHEVSRNAVRRALAEDARMEYWRPSATEEFEPAVRDVLADYPHMSVPDIATMVDWRKSRRTLSDLVARLRPEYIDRADSEATDGNGIAAAQLETITAGTFQPLKLLGIADIQARELTAQEVTWWTELKNATHA
ncbi:hypothetical protein ACPROK_14655 [Glutamicibacter soli]|uniref:hypothetical protein n=1 Tax=Glutamicibacter soli TaxID=453836 RepID=UPI003C76E822